MARRLFIGIELDDASRASLVAAVERVRESGRLPGGTRVIAPEAWHATLQFLGNVDDAQLAALHAALATAMARAPAFDAQLKGAGAFPSPRKARIMWAGFDRGAASIAALAREVEQATRALGFTAEEREHHPHVTWARAREPVDFRAAIAAFTLEHALPVRAIALFQSHLSQAGARYEVVQRYALQR